MAYTINGVYFSNMSKGLWLEVQIVFLNQQYPVIYFSQCYKAQFFKF